MSAEPHGVGPGRLRLNRRQMIAGSGIAAAAWVAPSVMRIDVASAAGTGPGSTVVVNTMTLTMLPGTITVSNPTDTSTMSGTDTFGRYGAQGPGVNGADLGPLFTLTDSAPTSTEVIVTVQICFNSTWDQTGSATNIDTIDIRVNGISGVDSASGIAFPTSMLVGDMECLTFTLNPITFSGMLMLEVEGGSNAQIEDFGIGEVMLQYC